MEAPSPRVLGEPRMNCSTGRWRLLLIALLVWCWLITDKTVAAQTVIDLHTIDADTTIIGSGYQSWINNAVVLDIDNNGKKDLFLRDAAYQESYGEECVFGFLDFSTSHGPPIIDVADKSYNVVIVGIPLVSDKLGYSLVSGDWNHDGVDDLAVGDPSAYQPQHIARGVVHVLWGGSRWHSGTVIDLSETIGDILIFSSDMATNPRWAPVWQTAI